MTKEYLKEERPPVCLHILGQALVDELHRQGRAEHLAKEKAMVSIREALYWLDNNAPGRAVESLQRAL